MKKLLGFAVLAMALSAPAGAQTPMGAMEYYVGSWSCMVGKNITSPLPALLFNTREA